MKILDANCIYNLVKQKRDRGVLFTKPLDKVELIKTPTITNLLMSEGLSRHMRYRLPAKVFAWITSNDVRIQKLISENPLNYD